MSISETKYWGDANTFGSLGSNLTLYPSSERWNTINPTANIDVTMPRTDLLEMGPGPWAFGIRHSGGSNTITVKDAGGTTIGTIAAGEVMLLHIVTLGNPGTWWSHNRTAFSSSSLEASISSVTGEDADSDPAAATCVPVFYKLSSCAETGGTPNEVFETEDDLSAYVGSVISATITGAESSEPCFNVTILDRATQDLVTVSSITSYTDCGCCAGSFTITGQDISDAGLSLDSLYRDETGALATSNAGVPVTLTNTPTTLFPQSVHYDGDCTGGLYNWSLVDGVMTTFLTKGPANCDTTSKLGQLQLDNPSWDLPANVDIDTIRIKATLEYEGRTQQDVSGIYVMLCAMDNTGSVTSAPLPGGNWRAIGWDQIILTKNFSGPLSCTQSSVNLDTQWIKNGTKFEFDENFGGLGCAGIGGNNPPGIEIYTPNSGFSSGQKPDSSYFNTDYFLRDGTKGVRLLVWLYDAAEGDSAAKLTVSNIEVTLEYTCP